MTTRWLDREVEGVPVFDDFPDKSGILEVFEDRSVAHIAHEMEALQASLRVADGEGDREHARLLGRTYLGRLDPETLEQHVIEGALRRILGREVGGELAYEPVGKEDWEKHVSERVALAWLAWASNDTERALDIVKSLRAGQKKRQTFTGQRTGAIHLLTLSFWSEAVVFLAKKDPSGARRFFKRAIELGSQFGTDSHPMISWAYAASFFDDAA